MSMTGLEDSSCMGINASAVVADVAASPAQCRFLGLAASMSRLASKGRPHQGKCPMPAAAASPQHHRHEPAVLQVVRPSTGRWKLPAVLPGPPGRGVHSRPDSARAACAHCCSSQLSSSCSGVPPCFRLPQDGCYIFHCRVSLLPSGLGLTSCSRATYYTRGGWSDQGQGLRFRVQGSCMIVRIYGRLCALFGPWQVRMVCSTTRQ